MEKDIQFCINATGDAIAYTLFGKGPLLVIPPGWVSHLEQQWKLPGVNRFFEQLAEAHTLLIFDKHGTGLSDRNRDDFTLEKDLADMEAVIDNAGVNTMSLFGYSMGGPLAVAYAVRHPDRVSQLILYGTFAKGSEVSTDEVRHSLVSLLRAHWGMGADLFSWLFVPDKTGDPEAATKISEFQRKSATGEIAAKLLELFYRIDIVDLLPQIRMPALVIHRRGDRAVPSIHGQKLAAAISGAHFVLMEGDIHFPWLGDSDHLIRVIREFLGDSPLPEIRIKTNAGSLPDAERATVSAANNFSGASRRKGDGRGAYRFVYKDLLQHSQHVQKEKSRVGIAQIDLAYDFLEEKENGLVGLRSSKIDIMKQRVEDMIDRAARQRIDVLVFPEMSIDMNHPALSDLIFSAAKTHEMIIVPGAFHDLDTKTNVCRVIGPEGVLWEQEKHIPAILTVAGRKIQEQIHSRPSPVVIVCNTRFGRIAVAICRDFLDMDLRVELKNFSPPADIVINPAFTPVTTDFEAAHLEARRSVYAYFFFCNVAAFGNSLIYSPEKGKKRRNIPPKHEGLIFKDIDLFNLRSERRKWEKIREQTVRFIQSTR